MKIKSELLEVYFKDIQKQKTNYIKPQPERTYYTAKLYNIMWKFSEKSRLQYIPMKENCPKTSHK